MESSCVEKYFIVNNENIQLSRIYSCPLDAESVRPESSGESEDDSDIDKYVKYSSFRKNRELLPRRAKILRPCPQRHA